jgi:hypothetical protein
LEEERSMLARKVRKKQQKLGGIGVGMTWCDVREVKRDEGMMREWWGNDEGVVVAEVEKLQATDDLIE